MAWGRNRNRPGHTLDALTAEASAELHDAHTFVVRIEHVQKDELLASPDPLAGRIFAVGELSAGYRHDFARSEHAVAGLGVLGAVAAVPNELRSRYGDRPLSVLVFLRLGLR